MICMVKIKEERSPTSTSKDMVFRNPEERKHGGGSRFADYNRIKFEHQKDKVPTPLKT